MKRKLLFAGVWAIVAVAAFTPAAQAQTFTWNGGGADGNWSTGANWGGTPPTAGATTDIALAGTTNLNTTLDLLNGTGGGPFDIRTLTYNANAGSFVINPTGSNVTSLRIGSGGIVMLSNTSVTNPPEPPPNIQATLNARTQTINVPVALSASQTWAITGGATPPALTTPAQLIVNGDVDLGGNTLTTNVALGTLLNHRPGEVRFNGAVSGGALVKTGTGVVTLNGATSLTSATVTAGTLAVNRAAAGANPFGAGAITLNGGALSFRLPQNPLTVTGFNQDVISSYSDSIAANPFGTTASLDAAPGAAAGFVLYEFGSNVNPGVQHTGLPTGGQVIGTHNTLATYQLANYGTSGVISNNSLYLSADSTNTGTLAIPAASQGSFSTLSLLGLGGGGATAFTARLNFSDGTSTDVNVNAPDWFNNAPFAITALGRMERQDGIFDNQTNNPRLYPIDINLSATDQAKTLTSIGLTRTGGGRLNIFGVSGTSAATAAAAPTSYANAVNVTASSTIEMWSTPNLTLGPLTVGSGSTDVSLTTVAGGTTTLTVPSTTLDAGTGIKTFNIAAGQTFLPGPLDYSSVAQNVTKGGGGIMNFDAAGVNATATNRLTVTGGTANVNNAAALGAAPNLTVSGGTANLGTVADLTSATVSGGTANLPSVTTVPTLTTTGGTTNFTLKPTVTTATLGGGTTNFNAGATLGTATVNGGTVNLGTTTQGAASSAERLTGTGGNIALRGTTGPTVLTIGSSGQDSSYGGVISGPGSLVKVGAGTQTLSGSGSTFAGGTTLTAGQITATRPGALGTGAVTLENGTALSIGGIPQGTTAISGFGGNGAGWNLQGGATVASDVLTITTNANNQARSAWNTTKQPTGLFFASFDYSRGAGSGNPADGATFTIQNQSATALGGGGGSLGYSGITPSASLQINIYNPNGRGLAFRTNGAIAGANNYTATAPVDIFNSTTAPVRFNLFYDGANLNVSLVQGTNTYDFPAVPLDLTALFGAGNTIWAGFTGATGGENAIQTFSNFTYTLGGAPTAISTYANAVNVAAAASSTIRPRVATGLTTYTMGALAMGSGATLNVSPDTGSLANTAYGLTLGATTLAGPATFAVANNGTGTGTLTLGAVSGTGPLTKAGAGTLVLAGAGTYAGDTTINEGTLRIGVAGALPDTGTLTIAANGTLSTAGGAAGAGITETAGVLRTTGSAIELGTGSHVLTFNGLASPAELVGSNLQVLGWTGSQFASGTQGDIVFNNLPADPNTVYQNWLSSVNFVGQAPGGFFLDIGSSQFELVPVPEPGAVLGVAVAGLAGLGLLRRRLRRDAGATVAA